MRKNGVINSNERLHACHSTENIKPITENIEEGYYTKFHHDAEISKWTCLDILQV